MATTRPELLAIFKLKDQVSQQLKKITGNTRTAATKMRSALTGLTGSVGKLRSAMGGLVGAYLGWRAIQAVQTNVRMFAFLEAQQLAFDGLRERIGANTDAVAKWREALRLTVGDSDILQQANKGIISGLITTEEQFTAVAEKAFLLARATGTEVLPQLQRLMQALGSGATRPLKELGIDMETIFRVQREMTGKDLPLEEKQRLALAALVQRTRGEFEKISEYGETTLESLQSQKRALDNVREAAGEVSKEMAKYQVEAAKQLEEGANWAARQLDAIGRAVGMGIQVLTTGGDKRLPGGPFPQKPKEDKPTRAFGHVDFGKETVSAKAQELAAWEKFWEAIKKGHREYMAEIFDIYDQTARLVIGVYQAAEDTVSSVFFDALTGKMETFREYLKAFAQDVARTLSRLAAQTFIKDILGAGIGALGGALGIGGGGGTEPHGFGQFPLKPGKQEGGVTRQPGLYPLSEGGHAEGVVPLSQGRFIPVEFKSAPQSPIHLAVHYHISAMDGPSVQRTVYEHEDTFVAPVLRALDSRLEVRAAFRGATR